MKKKEERLEKEMAEIQLQNKRLIEPLQKAREEVEDLRKQLANYKKDKASLAVSILYLFVAHKHFIHPLVTSSCFFVTLLAGNANLHLHLQTPLFFLKITTMYW